MPHSPHGVSYEAYRPVVMGRNGMVCAGHPLAAQAGIHILQQGGNAMDAAIAAAAALNVVEPNMSGIGGDGFLMVYDHAAAQVEVCNATGAAPYAADPELYRQTGIPHKGIRSVSVPGLLDGWLEAHQRYGSLPLAQLLAPAIDLAANGFPVTHVLHGVIAGDALLQQFPDSQAVFAPGGVPLRPGQILRQPGLARTFQAIADGGRAAFYEGEIAQALVKFSQKQGGLLSLADFADCRARWEAPIAAAYHGHTVFEAPPNSSGHVLLQELNLVGQFDLPALGCNTAESIHLMVEAKKLAFADREAYMADPDWVDIPTEGLISPQYAAGRAGLIDRERAAEVVGHGDPWSHQPANYRRRPSATSAAAVSRAAPMPEEDTTCFVVADRWGNAVCQLQSIQSSLGSSLVAGDTGILLNNRMTYWHLDPDHPDCLQPGKRVRHTMNPVMVFRNDGAAPPNGATGNTGAAHSNGAGGNGIDGGRSVDGNRAGANHIGGNGAGSMRRPGANGVDARIAAPGSLRLVCGTPGADTQVQTNLQVITHILDFGMTVAEAVEAPRWRNTHSPTESSIPHECANLLYVESRFPADTLAGLEQRGHTLERLPNWGASGSEMMIERDPETGALQGAADPRRDGYAIGW